MKFGKRKDIIIKIFLKPDKKLFMTVFFGIVDQISKSEIKKRS
jgi:hypothetical protein